LRARPTTDTSSGHHGPPARRAAARDVHGGPRAGASRREASRRRGLPRGGGFHGWGGLPTGWLASTRRRARSLDDAPGGGPSHEVRRKSECLMSKIRVALGVWAIVLVALRRPVLGAGRGSRGCHPGGFAGHHGFVRPSRLRRHQGSSDTMLRRRAASGSGVAPFLSVTTATPVRDSGYWYYCPSYGATPPSRGNVPGDLDTRGPGLLTVSDRSCARVRNARPPLLGILARPRSRDLRDRPETRARSTPPDLAGSVVGRTEAVRASASRLARSPRRPRTSNAAPAPVDAGPIAAPSPWPSSSKRSGIVSNTTAPSHPFSARSSSSSAPVVRA